jgi:hypothetical protein
MKPTVTSKPPMAAARAEPVPDESGLDAASTSLYALKSWLKK